jgi:hypothetical protein
MISLPFARVTAWCCLTILHAWPAFGRTKAPLADFTIKVMTPRLATISAWVLETAGWLIRMPPRGSLPRVTVP